ncbi:MAG: sugar ABC transporter ATP-binding protein [Spirochaetia bacterium]|jgi:simple sugar transport system ATP-binding protein|nr:sugar ABC transporter ATP-binding protein [Spirochaetia bacterium]
MPNVPPLLSLKGISKDFYGNSVLEDVTFDVEPGKIIGLVGENGAGKTTLMRILFGMPVIAQTGGYGGQIEFDGHPVKFKTPFEALDAGIGMVHQEFSLIPGFTTAENIVLNREPKKGNFAVEVFGDRLSILDRSAMRKNAEKAIDRLGVKLDTETLVSEMPVGHKQFTEIAREINRANVKLLVLDEPTAVLTETEAEILLEALRRLAAQGISIIFISHRLHEVVSLADTVIVLRDGHVVKNTQAAGTSVRDIASWMVGRSVETKRPDLSERKFTGEALKVERLWVDMPGEAVRDVSFTVKEGEIFGIGGLAGQGKLGIPNGVMGLYASGGSVLLHGKSVPLNYPRGALSMGMAFVSEDRRGVGLLLDETLEWNIGFTAMQIQNGYLKSYLGGLLKLRDESELRKLAQEYIDMLSIKCTGPKQTAKELSGGNQQKICLAKAFALRPNLLFVSEPTRGIDVGAKELVLQSLRHYNHDFGTTIVMVSSELEELRSICDRVAIVDEGRIAGILLPDADISEFGLLMAGAKQEEAARA